MTKKRNYGILMPIASLPSKEGIGTLGEEARLFIDYLQKGGAGIWQILPLNPTNYGDSPYQSCCANALNYYFIDLQTLVNDGLLTCEEVASARLSYTERRVNYSLQFNNKMQLLRKAYSRFDKKGKKFKEFLRRGEFDDFASFMSLKQTFDYKAWSEWDEPYRNFDGALIDNFIRDNREEFEFWQFTQYIFLIQWNALKSYAHKKGISIMGDIPLYLAYDSVEMWKYGDLLFKVDGQRRPQCVAGVPPDAFSSDGQLWGNPVYDWEKMKKDGYKWWNDRIKNSLELYDVLRVDHFRGFDRYYEIPSDAVNARDGVWCDGPKEQFFADKLNFNIVAEDLGIVDDGILRLMKNVGYPGMKILEFAFDGSPDNPHKPSQMTANCVCYTGTHDNMPLRQYIEDLNDWQRSVFVNDLKNECAPFGVEVDESDATALCRCVMEAGFFCPADTFIIPMCDVLAMGGEARINFPSTLSENNWSWRFVKSDFTDGYSRLLKNLAVKWGRV